MEVNWAIWQPKERATLLFVVKEGSILLIRKKRGLGAGKINAPGGRLEPGETPYEGALRETYEELGVEAVDPTLRGELYFQFVDGYSLFCSVFLAFDLRGEPIETEEAVPLWTPLEAIPYDEMWVDDQHWLPGVLAGRQFRGYFTFEGDAMLWHRVDWVNDLEGSVSAA
jgi:8-oxo-dGTP diphosphatase